MECTFKNLVQFVLGVLTICLANQARAEGRKMFLFFQGNHQVIDNGETFQLSGSSRMQMDEDPLRDPVSTVLSSAKVSAISQQCMSLISETANNPNLLLKMHVSVADGYVDTATELSANLLSILSCQVERGQP